jgi:hypothetical protein
MGDGALHLGPFEQPWNKGAPETLCAGLQPIKRQ